ncbi:PREDICTED: uncharacterized protein LOC18593443 [Theobroma cacao]|uniref:Uncharacterized protein LOC18593443 n=1 Tax=Theobroma cacao TaxID=3641 RepID=A0AB32WM64_THECC|nr:PREDICTED: uncharacterized protein LOC18593443 [Theobroma cacao]
MGKGSNLFLLFQVFNHCTHLQFHQVDRYSHQANSKENHEDFLHLARNNDPVAEEKAGAAEGKFERVSKQKGRAEEEAKSGDQRVASQTLEKIHDGAAEALSSDYKVDPVKSRYKEHVPRANYHKTGHLS